MLIVKLADRLHNMRTLDFVPPEKRQRIARETMDIYAPLAGRMGMQGIRSELEDLTFRRSSRRTTRRHGRLADLRERNAEIVEIMPRTCRQARARGHRGGGVGPPNRPWSIFRKIQRKQIALEQLSDMIGFRVIVETVEDCYRTLGVVHPTWKIVPGRFKDYHLDARNTTTTARSTPPWSGRSASASNCRSAPARCIRSPNTASPPTRSTRTISSHSPRAAAKSEDSQAYVLAATDDRPACRGRIPRISSRTPSSSCSRTRCSASRRGAADRAAARRDADRFRLCRPYRARRHLRRRQDQRQHHAALTQLRSATKCRSSAPIQVPPADWESSRVTGKARAAIRRAVRAAVASSMPGLAPAFWSGLERAARTSTRTRCSRRSAAAGARDSRRRARRCRPRRTRLRRRHAAPSFPTTRTNGSTSHAATGKMAGSA